MIRLLAETAAAAPSDPGVSGALLMQILGWVTSFVLAVVGAVAIKGVRATAKQQGKAEGKAEALQIGPQPFEVAVREQYVTRAECLACKTDMTATVREMRSMYDKTNALFMERDERSQERTKTMGEMLSSKIGELAERVHTRINELEETGGERRRRIHDKINEHADLLSRIDARTDVSKAIGKLGAAMMTLAKNPPN
jgi:hypothetical protein